MPKQVFLWLLLFFCYRIFVLITAGPGVLAWHTLPVALLADAAWAVVLSFTTTYFHTRRLRFAATLLQALVGIFLVVAYGFAKLYERPFTFAFVRLDTGTIWKENFVSGLHELGAPHAILAFFLAAIFYWQNQIARVGLQSKSLVIAIIALLIIVILRWHTPLSTELLANPLSAALAQRPAIGAAIERENGDHGGGVIPPLDDPESGTYLRPVKARRGFGRNVILYYLESTPFSVLGKKVQGRELTPNLNQLSKKSLIFTRHYANFPLSINAFYNSFCSAYALPDGAWISLVLPDFPVPCLSEVLAPQGYRSVVLHAGYLGYAKQKRFLEHRHIDLMLDAESLKRLPYEKGMGPWGAADERAMLKPLIEFAQREKSPFLALLFAFAPHHPYNVPEDFPEPFSAEPGLKKSQVRYFNSLHFADMAFGEILSGLEKHGILQNSILIVFGDHGEAFYEHAGNYNHPFFLYEENVHVPMLIWYDGVTPQEIMRVTSHVDILPTVLDLLDRQNLASPLHVGKSMLRHGAQSLAHLQAYWQEEFSGVVGERFKYIRKETGAEELFDLLSDSAERVNLAPKLSQVAEKYRRLTLRAFAQKKRYYEEHAGYKMARFNPASQDK